MAKIYPQASSLNGLDSGSDSLNNLLVQAEFNSLIDSLSTINSIKGIFAEGCILTDIAVGSGGDNYENAGTTDAPNFIFMGGPSVLPGLIDGEIWSGDVSNVPSAGYQFGKLDKTSLNKVLGSTKFDDRPAGGSLHDYNVQNRAVVGKTSGQYIGLDGETHLAATGSTSIRGTQGVAVVDATFTATGSTLIGTYGQARVDGGLAGGSFVAGLYGLVEASSAMTASHVCSAWFDSHQANVVTGSHELVYMTNNGTATMDQAFYIYGGNKISNLFELNTVGGMTNAADGAGADVYINITIDGVAARIKAKYLV